MVRLVLEGLDQFLADFRSSATTLDDEATQIVHRAAEAAVSELRGAYPTRDPASRSRFEPIGAAMVVQVEDQGPGHPKAVVSHREILAVWYERGTKTRLQRRTKRATGRMPAHPTFFPITVRHQRTMVLDLIQAATRAGFTVTD
jgi:hypothetical protein